MQRPITRGMPSFNTLGSNLSYVYTRNNPVGNVDPSGLHDVVPYPHADIGPPGGPFTVEPNDPPTHFGSSPLPGGYGHCKFDLIGRGGCFYGRVICRGTTYWIGMCSFNYGKIDYWMYFPPGGGSPIIHWLNWDRSHPNHRCHYYFDLHSKWLTVTCCKHYHDARGVKCYTAYSGYAPTGSGMSPPSDWGSRIHCNLPGETPGCPYRR
jgi:hypothetical protein